MPWGLSDWQPLSSGSKLKESRPEARTQPLLALLYEGLSANPRVCVLSPDPRKVDNSGVISFVTAI